MIPLEVMRSMVEVDEEMIKQAAEMLGGDNSFKSLLVMGTKFKHANLEPIYLTDMNQEMFTVTCSQTMDSSKLH